jgi:acyl-CoA synthetase (AMP-forming)/AMP-acid ligase II
MSATASSISALLSRRAQQQQPDLHAYPLVDDDVEAPGDRVAICHLLVEAVVHVASSGGRPWSAVRFDYDKLSAGHAPRCGSEQAGSDLVSHGTPGACTVRIVDPATCVESPAGVVGEIWVHGDNVAAGYWRNPELTEHTFGARLPHPSPGTPAAISVSTDDGEQPVRRSTCAERYRQLEFARLEVCA